MSTDNLSGTFTYDGLRAALKQKGIQNNNMNSALRQIADKNNLDNIRDLDGKQQVNVDASIFNKFASPVEKVDTKKDEDILKSYDIDTTNIGDDGFAKLPEVFDADEYEVVDYDDYYGFAEENKENATDPINRKNNNADDTSKMSYDQFKNEFQLPSGSKVNMNNDEVSIQQLFNSFDKNSDSYLDKTEQNAAKKAFQGPKQDKMSIDPFKSEEDPFAGSLQMEMNMSGDSFNPQ